MDRAGLEGVVHSNFDVGDTVTTIQPGVGVSNLPPIPMPSGALVPDWAKEAIHRLNMLTGCTVVFIQDKGGYGSSAFIFGANNAQLAIPSGGLNQTIYIPKATSTGSPGWIQFNNGIAVQYQAAT